jgi:hypothetical protein
MYSFFSEYIFFGASIKNSVARLDTLRKTVLSGFGMLAPETFKSALTAFGLQWRDSIRRGLLDYFLTTKEGV